MSHSPRAPDPFRLLALTPNGRPCSFSQGVLPAGCPGPLRPQNQNLCGNRLAAISTRKPRAVPEIPSGRRSNLGSLEGEPPTVFNPSVSLDLWFVASIQ